MEKNLSSKSSNTEQYEGFPTRLAVLLAVIVLGVVFLVIKALTAF